jgi:carbon monoxide dehydrogenase subunit G
MDFSDEHTFDAPLDEVWAMFCDPASHVKKFESMGHRDIEVVESQHSDDAFRLVVRRNVDVDLPGFAKRVLKPTNTVVTTDDWTRGADGVCRGTQHVETQGTPVKIDATTQLAPDGDTTTYSVAIQLDVKVPLIGGKLADWAKGMVSEQLDEEFSAGDRWLAGSAGD